jgi:hypothetical protein
MSALMISSSTSCARPTHIASFEEFELHFAPTYAGRPNLMMCWLGSSL